MPLLSLIAMLSCPGQNTLQMQACEAKNLERSDLILQEKMNSKDFDDWADTRKKVCELAKQPLANGSIYGQLLIGCFNQMKESLIAQFRSLADSPVDQRPSDSTIVHCVIQSESGHTYEGGCNFAQFGGNGSFYLRNEFTDSALLPGVYSFIIQLSEEHSPVIKYKRILRDGSNRDFVSPAMRSKDDSACWVTRGLSVCAY